MTQSSKSAFLRQQLLVDHHVQGALLKRTGLYSVSCAVYFAVILVFTESMSRPDELFSEAIFRCLDEAIYWAPGLILLTPLVAYDMLKLTNRFAGPVFRLRREMKRLINGESIQPLSFRDGDHWPEMAELFNQLRQELIELRQKHEPSRDAQEATSVTRREKLFVESDEEPAEDFLVSASS